MGSYSIELKPSVHKEFRRIPPKLIPRILEVIESLADSPFPVQSLKLSGAGRLYRARVGDYRILYEVDAEARVVMVHHVRHRREAYR